MGDGLYWPALETNKDYIQAHSLVPSYIYVWGDIAAQARKGASSSPIFIELPLAFSLNSGLGCGNLVASTAALAGSLYDVFEGREFRGVMADFVSDYLLVMRDDSERLWEPSRFSSEVPSLALGSAMLQNPWVPYASPYGGGFWRSSHAQFVASADAAFDGLRQICEQMGQSLSADELAFWRPTHPPAASETSGTWSHNGSAFSMQAGWYAAKRARPAAETAIITYASNFSIEMPVNPFFESITLILLSRWQAGNPGLRWNEFRSHVLPLLTRVLPRIPVAMKEMPGHFEAHFSISVRIVSEHYEVDIASGPRGIVGAPKVTISNESNGTWADLNTFMWGSAGTKLFTAINAWCVLHHAAPGDDEASLWRRGTQETITDSLNAVAGVALVPLRAEPSQDRKRQTFAQALDELNGKILNPRKNWRNLSVAMLCYMQAGLRDFDEGQDTLWQLRCPSAAFSPMDWIAMVRGPPTDADGPGCG